MQKGIINMQPQKFRVSRIEGEYAYISPLDGGDEIFIALALLPLGADVGSVLICEDFSFSLYE